FFFFFSSRRRHTRLQGDWSSDVCSSDLLLAAIRAKQHFERHAAARARPGIVDPDTLERRGLWFLGRLDGQVDPIDIDGFIVVSQDRKSTRLNSSHLVISYAVFCLKKKRR